MNMLILMILLVLIGYNLVGVVSQERKSYYKDFRFWMVVFSLLVLVLVAMHNYY